MLQYRVLDTILYVPPRLSHSWCSLNVLAVSLRTGPAYTAAPPIQIPIGPIPTPTALGEQAKGQRGQAGRGQAGRQRAQKPAPWPPCPTPQRQGPQQGPQPAEDRGGRGGRRERYGESTEHEPRFFFFMWRRVGADSFARAYLEIRRESEREREILCGGGGRGGRTTASCMTHPCGVSLGGCTGPPYAWCLRPDGPVMLCCHAAIPCWHPRYTRHAQWFQPAVAAAVAAAHTARQMS